MVFRALDVSNCVRFWDSVTETRQRPRTTYLQRYPIIKPEKYAAERLIRPMSFVSVHYSDEIYHNLLISECVQDAKNELIIIDNREGHRFDTLSAAINAGIDSTVHDLVAVVHEDVFLVRHWQTRMMKSLQTLELVDPNWGVAGSVGWNDSEDLIGHWTDPRGYTDTLGDHDFSEVRRLDEQILIFRQSTGLRFDAMLPSIHNIGRDLASTLATQGRKCYAINAPTIHKYADKCGTKVLDIEQSEKIQVRALPANQAERRCSDAYLHAKWPVWAGTGLGGGAPEACDATSEARL